MKQIIINSLYRIILATTIFYMLPSVHCNAQCIQKGKVMQYQGKTSKTVLGGVEILAANAGSTISGAQGEFSLNFKKLKAGDRVKIMRVEKNGYILFNKEAVDQWYISRTGQPFTIVMCKEEKYREIRNHYERISSESYAKKMKAEENQLSALRKQNKLTEENYKKRLEQLHYDYETQLENLDTYIDRVARYDLSELSEEQNDIISLIQQGKIDEAVKAYEDMNLEEKFERETNIIGSIDNSREKLDGFAQEERQKALQTYEANCRKNDILYLAGGSENMKKIKESMRKVAFADTTFVKAMIDYVKFLNDQRDFTETVELLDIAENNTDDFWLLNDIYAMKTTAGMVLDDQEMAYNYAIKELEAVFNNKDIDSVQMAMLATSHLVMAATVPLHFENFKGAEELLLSTLENSIQLHNDMPDIFGLSIPCLTYEMLSFVYLYLGELDKMSAYMTKYENAFKTLYEEGTPKYDYEMSTLLGLQGSRLMMQGKIEEGLSYANKSVEILKSLAEKNPLKYHDRLANIYSTIIMGYIYNRQYMNAFNTVKQMFNSIGYYFGQLYGINSRKSYYSMMSYVFGEMVLDRGKSREALKHFEKALNELNEENLSFDGRIIKAMALYGKARTYLAMGQHSNAILAFYESKKYMEEFYKLYPLLYGRYFKEINSHKK